METHEQAVKRGKKSRSNGSDFERRVRKDLEEKGWIVDKWSNNIEFYYECPSYKKECFAFKKLPQKGDLVDISITNSKQKNGEEIKCNTCGEILMLGNELPMDYISGKLVSAKNKWNNFTKSMMMGTGGFPDFKCHRLRISNSKIIENNLYEVIGIECKSNGYLKPEEKEKCQWLIENNIFSKILVASKYKEGRKIKIKYEEFNNA